EGGEENTNISNDGLHDDIASTTTEGTPKEKSVAQVNQKRVLQQPASAMPVSSAKKMSKTKMAENVYSVITSILNKPKPIKDQFGIYGEHVASVLRQLQTKREHAMVKHDINNILFKAEMGEYAYGGAFDFHYPPPWSTSAISNQSGCTTKSVSNEDNSNSLDVMPHQNENHEEEPVFYNFP
ncbi:hypothetical protein J6590_028190, partial [Homalodisca vitripennis]